MNSKRDEELFVIVAKFLGEIREIVGFRINWKQEVFSFPPFARVSEIDFHSSKHLSGERHFKLRVGKNRHPMQETKVQLQPLSNFFGIEPLMNMSCLKGEFLNSRLPGTNEGQVISMDLDAANFNDDIFFIKIYLVEPNKENLVPLPINAGPRVLHFIRNAKPWIAVDIFQEMPHLLEQKVKDRYSPGDHRRLP